MATKPTARVARRPKEEFIFRPFNTDSIEATRDEWLADVEAGEGFLPEVEQLMAWVAAHMEVTENEIAYGVFRHGERAAVGICEVAVTRPSARGKWVKLIKLRLRPQVDGGLFANDPDAFSLAVNAYTCAVLGVYHVKNVHGATIIKVYGRTQEQMRFLNYMLDDLNQNPDVTFKAEMQGRWLVLNWGTR